MNETYDYRERKTVAVLSSKIPAAHALNVVGHLCLSIGHSTPASWMGRSEHIDKSGISHRGISKYPVIITRVKPSSIRKALAEARKHPDLLIADFPRQMLDTGLDNELADSLAQADEAQMEYLGIVLSGPTALIQEITGRFSLWRDEQPTSSSAAPEG